MEESEEESEESTIPYLLEYWSRTKLEGLVPEQLREECMLRSIDIGPRSHSKTCIDKLLKWKAEQRGASVESKKDSKAKKKKKVESTTKPIPYHRPREGDDVQMLWTMKGGEEGGPYLKWFNGEIAEIASDYIDVIWEDGTRGKMLKSSFQKKNYGQEWTYGGVSSSPESKSSPEPTKKSGSSSRDLQPVEMTEDAVRDVPRVFGRDVPQRRGKSEVLGSVEVLQGFHCRRTKVCKN